MAAFRGALLPGSACCMSAPSRLGIATRQAAAVPPPSGAQGAAAFQRAGRTREACSPSPWVCCGVSHGSRLQPVQAEAPSCHARGSCPGTLQMCVQRMRSERSLPLGTGSGWPACGRFAAVRHLGTRHVDCEFWTVAQHSYERPTHGFSAAVLKLLNMAEWGP